MDKEKLKYEIMALDFALADLKLCLLYTSPTGKAPPPEPMNNFDTFFSSAPAERRRDMRWGSPLRSQDVYKRQEII